MTTVVPFASRESDSVIDTWLVELNAAFREKAQRDRDRSLPVVVEHIDGLAPATREAAQVAVVANPEAGSLATLPSLVWVQSLWAGVENLLVELPDSIAIVRMEDPRLADTMAQAVLAWTLYLHRDMPTYARQQRERVWRQHAVRQPAERCVAVLGLGNLGRRACATLVAQGFAVLGWSRTPQELPGVECHAGDAGLAAVLRRADIVVVLLPLTGGTRGLLDAPRLGLLRPDAAVVNFGRGPIVEQHALVAHLDAHPDAHAVLDVFDAEPLPSDHPYWSHPQVTVLPHVAAPTDPHTASRIAASQVAMFLRDGTVPDTVDRQRGY